VSCVLCLFSSTKRAGIDFFFAQNTLTFVIFELFRGHFFKFLTTFSNFFPIFGGYLRIWSRQIPIFNLKTKTDPKKHQKNTPKICDFSIFQKNKR
jgi:hypothetical protein